ncbi:ATP-binding protein [Dethiobacter alkaliphilus]|uniref:histidine kinase n=1 Tax=Dethiobacter alkaliphilus AHT 1 TaxID=555088 RepID=C0GI10_DETAL|nr:sensor histidine kinase [Dethiobacter alkaliphilus]EEG77084.1 integral membrane sensor signal transduction histidine kinase [Dethiobacter alkaliphilus AHT 1]
MDLIMSSFQYLLLNIFFIMAFIYIHNRYIEKRVSNIPKELLICAISTVLIILCMTFPIPFFDGHIFDLRQVPIVTGMLYGGPKVALLLLGVFTSYRFYIGGEGFYGAVLTNVLLFASLLYIRHYFNKLKSIEQRVKLSIIAGSLGIIWMTIVIAILYGERMVEPFIIFLLIFLIIQCLATAISVYFFEKNKLDTSINKELKKLERLETVSEIAASISHEVRNPLTTIGGFLQLLKDSKLPEEKRQTYIELCLEELDRATNIITNYLSLAKPSLDNMKVLELNKEIEYVISVIEPYATLNGVEVKLSQLDSMHVLGESQKLHQCLINLLKNGIESMSQGGTLEVTINKSGENALVIISDTGEGMDEEQISKLGTLYYSTKSKGTGLGTMVAYSIIKSFRGKIGVQSEVGKGTQFTIQFPIIDQV